MVMAATKTDTGMQTLYASSMDTAHGTCNVLATERGVCWTGTPGTERAYGLQWLSRKFLIKQVIEGAEVAPLRQAMEELQRYFAGERIQFACALDLYGTPFQIAVWEALYRIPYGETRTYMEIAQAIGQPKAVRAVGAANGANPVAVIVPCHRVIGSDGKLTGYGGGLPMKQWLLELEGARSRKG